MEVDPHTSETKPCPWCAETILVEAKKCKHCGEYLDDIRANSRDATGPSHVNRSIARSRWVPISIAFVIFAAAGVTAGLWASRTATHNPHPIMTQALTIDSLSMYPTLKIGDTIIVNDNAYRSTAPAIGDIIVFRAPTAEIELCDSPGVVDLVKRIVGTPGETLWSDGNTVYIDGSPLAQTWPHVAQLGTPIVRQTIPSGDFFVLGDNHPASCDSRIWGDVPGTDIVGKAIRWSSTSGSGNL
jgi:signal peptidase I